MSRHYDDRAFYSALGFRCGVEVHQQLDTRRKLFCHCPVGLQSVAPDAKIVRHMRPTMSEMGGYDGTALMEFKTRKHVVYELYRDSTCTYEMDDTPPFPINQEALDIAISAALLLNCSIVDEVHVTRKQYLDGSIPTGFQRTAVVGVNGWIPFGDGKLEILQVNIEEDSCREVSDVGHIIHWKTDRLSTPLIEVITAPQMRTPAEAAEAVRLISRVTRATGKVRRGRGAARQDVNVSITGTTRIEIKGVPSYRLIPKLTHHEGLRQQGLLRLRDLLRKALEGGAFKSRQKIYAARPPASVKRALGERLGKQEAVGVMLLPKLRGVCELPLVGKRRFFDELADRLRVIACLTAQPILMAEEIDDPRGLDQAAWNELRQLLQAQEQDALLCCWGTLQDVETALAEIKARLSEAMLGAPAETREVLADGTTGFERILPGPDRMYPDTDSPPTVITPERLQRLRAQLPKRPWEEEAALTEQGISPLTARLLLGSRWRASYELFSGLLTGAAAGDKPARRLANFIVNRVCGLERALRRRGAGELQIATVEQTLSWLAEGTLTWEALPLVIERLHLAQQTGKTASFAEIWPAKPADITAILKEAVSQRPQVRSREQAAAYEFLMGRIMHAWRGYLPGAHVAMQLSKTF